MTWVSHNMVTFVTLYAATLDPSAAFCGMLGSTFPDRVEGPLWQHWHRTYSHWFVLYIPSIVLFYPYGGTLFPAAALAISGIGRGLRCCLFWFLIGALLHILEDAVCGTIPVWEPKKKIKALPRLFYVGSAKEYLFVAAYCVVAALVAAKR